MADPARVPDPRLSDPLNPNSPRDPLNPDRTAANDPRVVNRVETRSGGSSIMIAAVVIVLAIIAYFVFAPGTDTAVDTDQPAATDTDITVTPPADPATPAPDATAPADPATPAPDATAPADPAAPAPDATAPADPAAPAPDATAPAPAPAPAN